MKKILTLTAIALLLTFSFSCEKDDSELNIDSITEQEKIIESNLNAKVLTGCHIIGPSVASDDISYVEKGETTDYSYTNNTLTGIPDSITWELTDVSPFGSARFTNNMLTYTGLEPSVMYSSNFSSATLIAHAIGEGIDNCVDRVNVILDKNVPPVPEPCYCPSPVIDDKLCVSGGHPHWRFQVDGISSSDQITWSINHGTIHSNPNQSYVIIEPNSGSTYGFTVYCKVERTCPNGSKKVRTAYYTNYYGNSCGTGTTGFVGSCSGGSMIDDLE